MELICPRCRSAKYTSLPFGNELTASGAAKYRCLGCGAYFASPRESFSFWLKPALKIDVDDSVPAVDLDLAPDLTEERRRRPGPMQL